MSSDSPSTTGSGDVPKLLVTDTKGRQLLCFVEELIRLDGNDYALLTPVDTPVTLVRLPQSDDEEPEEIEDWDEREPILEVAEAVLQEHNVTLVRSAATLTVTGDFDDSDLDEEEDEEEIDAEDAVEAEGEGGDLFESLLDRPFYVGEEQYDLFVPLDPFFIVARVERNNAVLVEGEEFERIQPRLEAELEERDLEA